MDVAIRIGLPIGNGILTADRDEQAGARARPGGRDKGGDAARAALALLRLKRRLTKAQTWQSPDATRQ